MRLQEIIDIIKKIGGSQPNVNSTTEGSIYEILNTDPSIDYANFHITQNKHTSNNQFITYNFILFYTDRLMDDKGNKLQIQSIGIEVLSNVLRTIQNYYEDVEVTNTDFQPFTERFSDNCAGVFSNVSLVFPIEYTCEESFAIITDMNGSNGECDCEINNQYIEVNVNENGRLVVNYNPNIYTGIERVVINTNVPQTIISGDTINNQNKTVSYTNNGNYTVTYDGSYTGLERVNINVNVPQTIITGDTINNQNKVVNISSNGTTQVTFDDGYTGLGLVNINTNIEEQTFETENITITNNGTYYPTKDGFDKVVVNVPQEIISGGTTTLTGSIVAKSGFELFKGQSIISVGDVYIKGSEGGDVSGMFENCQYLTSVGNIYQDDYYFINLTHMFYNCWSLTSLDLSNWDTSKVTKMFGMFYNSYALTSVGDLSGWNTSNVTDMSVMFYNCNSLTSVGDLSNWDTIMVTEMFSMFNNCWSLTSLDLNNWDTSNVTNMQGMFYNCSGITSLDLSKWDTSKVTNMQGMFSGCKSLTSLDLSGWNMSKITSMYTSMRWMFDYCTSLTYLNMNGATLPDVNLNGLGLETAVNLSVDSLVSILNALPITTNGYTLTIGSTNLAKLTPEQITIATNKGWTIN